MSGFVPLTRSSALRRLALGATSSLLLVAASGHALAQAPLGTFPDVSAQSRTAYAPADRVTANLLASGMSRLAAISAQQGGAVSSVPWGTQPVAPDTIVNDRRIKDFSGKLGAL